jgi:signal transduction histidine kinase/CheY-like chemotaxis protein
MKYTIRAKLLLAFTLIIVLTSAVNIYGLIQMERLAGLTTKIYNHPLQVTRAVLTANTNIIKMHRSMKDVALAETQTDIETAHSLVKKYEQEVYKQFAIVKQWILGKEGALLITDTIQMFRDWAPIREEVIALMTKKQQEKASAITKGKGAKHVTLLNHQMEILTNYAANKANSMYDSAHTTRNTVMITTIIALTIVLITSIILIVFLSRNIVNSVRMINQIAHQMVAGEITATVNNQALKEKITAYQDEMGEIGRAFYSVVDYCNAVMKDIIQISQGLAQGDLQVTSKADYRGDFIQIKNALETALANQREVIEDIVLVSEGLAKGTLTIVAQAKYQGDFVKIKDALETALTDLRSLIQDIVQVSQGLAEGKEITPQAEYQGDLIQIKKALEMAATKLGDTTNKNVQQDWLKTGQNQLNDQMSGEQNIVELTHNIVSFLTLYLEAQVGVCYLINDTSNNHQNHHLEIVASYAQTRRKNLAEEFQFSEGLVERAAKELQTILIKIEVGLEDESMPRYIMIIPFLHENIVKGVIVLGALKIFTQTQQEFLQQVMPSIGIAVNSIESRTQMQQLLQQTQAQTTELQSQQAELQQRNEELQSQSEELQSQAEELQSQAEELRQTNDELEERTQDLERQKSEIRDKNLALEKTQQAIETKAQELELASRYKSEFLANMSHELRTPLNSLLILSQLLADNKSANLTDKQIEYARTIHSAGSDLLSLINDILDLSKVEAGKIEIHLEEIFITGFIETLQQKFSPVAEDKGLAFHVTVADDVPTLLKTDGQRLNQIINNLLSNAFKFTHQGDIKMTISLPPLPQGEGRGEGQIIISVSDTGIGIPKDKQQVIFEAFQQADGTTSRRYGGTGLGLSISRQLARLLGGDLQLHSEEGKGSTFILYLPLAFPLAPSQEPLPQEERETTENIAISSQRERSEEISPPQRDDRHELKPEDHSILIIDDDRKFSKILMELARQKQFKCLVAEDGETGLQFAKKYKPSAIILDIGLPQMDGWMVMDQLKDNPDTRHIPVHFLSAFNQSLEAKKMGSLGYLVKPVNMEQLGDAFRKIEQFLTRTVKNLLVVVDNEIRRQKILDLVTGENIQITSEVTIKAAFQQVQTMTFDCIILDLDIEQGTGTQLLEQMQQESDLCQVPVIVYAERELTSSEESLLLQCSDAIPIKSVTSSERLLDEATLFLHQVEAKLPEEKRNILRMVHDKTTILRLKKVLIVDDDMRNTFALTSILEDNDMEVVYAQNGYEALDKLKANEDIAIILMDIMMPEMDGYEAMQQIRKQPHYHKLPIIALTAKAMKGDKAKCIEAGANDYLSKPVDSEQLISLMRVWLYK